MKLILSKYPKLKKTDHDGDSALEFQVGERTTDYGKLTETFKEHVEDEHGEEDFELSLGKYPKRKLLKHDGDSEIIYESGKRVTDISKLDEAFDDLVEETEGTGGSPNSFQALFNSNPGIKKVPKQTGTFPTELGYEKRIHSTYKVKVDTFRPTAEEVLMATRIMKNKSIQEQMLGMLFSSEKWLSELCDGLSEYKEHVL